MPNTVFSSKNRDFEQNPVEDPVEDPRTCAYRVVPVHYLGGPVLVVSTGTADTASAVAVVRENVLTRLPHLLWSMGTLTPLGGLEIH